jgi:hypothetical protein
MYKESPQQTEAREKGFTYHPPKGGQPERYQDIRASFNALALTLNENCPPSRELSVAMTHLETASFFANAAIARNE